MDMSKDKNRALVTGLMLVFLAVFFIALIPSMLGSIAGERPLPTPLALPSDICMIDGKPLTPELDIAGQGTLVLKYINIHGDLVLLMGGSDKPFGIYEGDFCY